MNYLWEVTSHVVNERALPSLPPPACNCKGGSDNFGPGLEGDAGRNWYRYKYRWKEEKKLYRFHRKNLKKSQKWKKNFFSVEKILGFLYNSVETYRIRLNFCFPLDNNYLRYLNMFRAEL